MINMKINVRIILSKLLSFIVSIFNKKIKTFSKNKEFFLFLYGGIGDHLMLFNLINYLKNNFQVTLFIDERNQDITKIYNDYNIVIYKKKLFNIYNLLRKHTSKDFIYVSWTSSIESLLIFLLSRSHHFFGIKGSFNYLFDTNKKEKINMKNRYQIYDEFIKKIKIKNNSSFSNGINTTLFFNENSSKLTVADNYILCNINKTAIWGNVSVSHKFWSKIFIDLSKIFKDIRFVITGSKNEIDFNYFFINKLSADIQKKILNYTGQTSFNDLIHLIKNSKFIICNDTSTLHLASLLNKKTLPMFTFSDPEVYNNPNNKYFFFNKKLECQTCITSQYDGCDNYPPNCLNNYECSNSLNDIDYKKTLNDFIND